MFKTYSDICQHLHALGLFHMDLSLTRMKNALEALSLTHLPFIAVQVVGTNGKGSTSTFLESLARAHGLKTGLFTSPHFVTPSERIHINGRPLEQTLWPALGQKVYDAAPELTYFEFLTVLATLAFTEAHVDIAIIEAGLGGHYDATTALDRHALCLTPISLDHESVLGATALAIATDKAHAMTKNMPVFLGKQEAEIEHFLQDFAKQCGAMVHPMQKNILPSPLQLGLSGSHQEDNATLALTAWQWLAKRYNWDYAAEKIHAGLANAFIPGRLHSIACEEPSLPPYMLLDGAHNAHGLERLLHHMESMTRKNGTKPGAIIFSCLADKDIQKILPLLRKLHALSGHCPLYIVDIQNNTRALSSEEKVLLAQEIGHGARTGHSLETTLAQISNTLRAQGIQNPAPTLLCGSLYLLGEFFEKHPRYLVKNIEDCSI